MSVVQTPFDRGKQDSYWRLNPRYTDPVNAEAEEYIVGYVSGQLSGEKSPIPLAQFYHISDSSYFSGCENSPVLTDTKIVLASNVYVRKAVRGTYLDLLELPTRVVSWHSAETLDAHDAIDCSLYDYRSKDWHICPFCPAQFPGLKRGARISASSDKAFVTHIYLHMQDSNICVVDRTLRRELMSRAPSWEISKMELQADLIGKEITFTMPSDTTNFSTRGYKDFVKQMQDLFNKWHK